MNSKIVALVALFAILFGCAYAETCGQNNIQLSVFGSSNQWWIAVAPLNGASETVTLEVSEASTGVWTAMLNDPAWGFWQVASTSGNPTGFQMPLSFRLTDASGEQVVLASVMSAIAGGSIISTSAQFGSSATQAPTAAATQAPTAAATQAPIGDGKGSHTPTVAPTEAATHRPTQRPTQPAIRPTQVPTHAATNAPTHAPTHAATVAPTHAATVAPTHAATVAPTHAATVAPTHAATVAPTHAATVAPTHAATVAPTHAATVAPTHAATVAPTHAATQGPTKKPTSAPTSGSSSSGNLCTVTPNTQEPLKLLVPLYVYPGSAWTEVIAGQQAGVETIAIINPDNGPDSTADSSYTSYMAQMKAAGVTMIGYIHTSYGARSIADVTADIATYASQYPGLAGIFIDEASASASEISYYTQVYNAILSHSGYTIAILNPGTTPDQGYLAISSSIVVFEDVGANLKSSDFPSWMQCAPTAAEKTDYKYKFSGIAYAAPQSTMASILNTFNAGGLGMVYVTSGAAGGATYNTLPSFYASMVSAVDALN